MLTVQLAANYRSKEAVVVVVVVDDVGVFERLCLLLIVIQVHTVCTTNEKLVNILM